MVDYISSTVKTYIHVTCTYDTKKESCLMERYLKGFKLIISIENGQNYFNLNLCLANMGVYKKVLLFLLVNLITSQVLLVVPRGSAVGLT